MDITPEQAAQMSVADLQKLDRAMSAGSPQSAQNANLQTLTNASQPGAVSSSGIPNLVRGAGSVATAGSLGAIEAGKNLARNAVLYSRDILDNSGLGVALQNAGYNTKAETQSLRVRAEQERQRTVARSPDIQANPGVFKAMDVVGQLIPEFALGTTLGNIGANTLMTGATKAGTWAPVAKQAVSDFLSFFLQGSFQDPGQDGSRLKSGLIAGTGAAAIGAVTNRATYTALINKGKGAPDPAILEAYKTMGIEPLPSQVIKDRVAAEKAASFESKLAKIPGTGLVERGEQQKIAFNNKVRQIAKEIDDGVTKSADDIHNAFQASLDNALVSKTVYAMQNTQKALQDIVTNPTFKDNRVVNQKVLDFLATTESNSKKLYDIASANQERKLVDDGIALLKSNNNLTKLQKKLLIPLRQAMEKDVEAMAAQSGNGKLYLQAKQMYQEQIARKNVQSVLMKAVDVDTGTVNLKTLNTGFKTLQKNMTIDPFKYGKMTPEIKKATDAMRIISSQLLSSPVKATLSNMMARYGSTGLIGAGAGYLGIDKIQNALVPPGEDVEEGPKDTSLTHTATVALGTVLSGLAMMAATKYGIKMLTEGATAGVNSSAMQQAKQMAIRLGVSGLLVKHQAGEARPLAPEDVSKLSIDQLKALDKSYSGK